MVDTIFDWADRIKFEQKWRCAIQQWKKTKTTIYFIDFDKSVRFFSYMCVLWKRNRFKGFQSILLLFSNWECYPIADESIFRVLSIQRNHLFQVLIYNLIFRELFCLDVYVMNFFWISNKVWAQSNNRK